MMAPRRPHPGRRHLPPGVAASSGKIAVIAATTTLVGATCPRQIARFALGLSIPPRLHHRAMAMRPHQCRLLQHHQRRHRHHQPPHRRRLHSQQSTATLTRHRHSCAQVATCAPIAAATLALARDAGMLEPRSSQFCAMGSLKLC